MTMQYKVFSSKSYALPSGSIFTLIPRTALKEEETLAFSIPFFYQEKPRWFLICIINKNKARATDQQDPYEEQSKKQQINYRDEF